MRAALVVAAVLALASCGNERDTIDLSSTADASDAAMGIFKPDRGVTDTGTTCTCMQPQHIGETCGCESWISGCESAPYDTGRICDLPPPCWLRWTDPITGCPRIEPDIFCGQSCARPDAG